jgi:uncharacterized protein (UPF0335 family)
MTTTNAFIEKLVNIYSEIDLLSEDVKTVVAEIKTANLDHSLLCKIAKAKVANKLTTLQKQSESILEVLNGLN